MEKYHWAYCISLLCFVVTFFVLLLLNFAVKKLNEFRLETKLLTLQKKAFQKLSYQEINAFNVTTNNTPSGMMGNQNTNQSKNPPGISFVFSKEENNERQFVEEEHGYNVPVNWTSESPQPELKIEENRLKRQTEKKETTNETSNNIKNQNGINISNEKDNENTNLNIQNGNQVNNSEKEKKNNSSDSFADEECWPTKENSEYCCCSNLYDCDADELTSMQRLKKNELLADGNKPSEKENKDFNQGETVSNNESDKRSISSAIESKPVENQELNDQQVDKLSLKENMADGILNDQQNMVKSLIKDDTTLEKTNQESNLDERGILIDQNIKAEALEAVDGKRKENNVGNVSEIERYFQEIDDRNKFGSNPGSAIWNDPQLQKISSRENNDLNDPITEMSATPGQNTLKSEVENKLFLQEMDTKSRKVDLKEGITNKKGFLSDQPKTEAAIKEVEEVSKTVQEKTLSNNQSEIEKFFREIDDQNKLSSNVDGNAILKDHRMQKLTSKENDTKIETVQEKSIPQNDVGNKLFLREMDKRSKQNSKVDGKNSDYRDKEIKFDEKPQINDQQRKAVALKEVTDVKSKMLTLQEQKLSNTESEVEKYFREIDDQNKLSSSVDGNNILNEQQIQKMSTKDNDFKTEMPSTQEKHKFENATDSKRPLQDKEKQIQSKIENKKSFLEKDSKTKENAILSDQQRKAIALKEATEDKSKIFQEKNVSNNESEIEKFFREIDEQNKVSSNVDAKSILNDQQLQKRSSRENNDSKTETSTINGKEVLRNGTENKHSLQEIENRIKQSSKVVEIETVSQEKERILLNDQQRENLSLKDENDTQSETFNKESEIEKLFKEIENKNIHKNKGDENENISQEKETISQEKETTKNDKYFLKHQEGKERNEKSFTHDKDIKSIKGNETENKTFHQEIGSRNKSNGESDKNINISQIKESTVEKGYLKDQKRKEMPSIQSKDIRSGMLGIHGTKNIKNDIKTNQIIQKLENRAKQNEIRGIYNANNESHNANLFQGMEKSSNIQSGISEDHKESNHSIDGENVNVNKQVNEDSSLKGIINEKRFLPVELKISEHERKLKEFSSDIDEPTKKIPQEKCDCYKIIEDEEINRMKKLIDYSKQLEMEGSQQSTSTKQISSNIKLNTTEKNRVSEKNKKAEDKDSFDLLIISSEKLLSEFKKLNEQTKNDDSDDKHPT